MFLEVLLQSLGNLLLHLQFLILLVQFLGVKGGFAGSSHALPVLGELKSEVLGPYSDADQGDHLGELLSEVVKLLLEGSLDLLSRSHSLVD